MKIVELKTPVEMQRIYPLIKQLNPGLTRAEFTDRLKEMMAQNYRCIMATEGAKILGTAGFWQATRFWCGRYMEMDNVVVDRRFRNKGIGALLVRWVEKEARRRKCRLVMAASYAHNTASHRFYFRERYIILGYCFVKKLRRPQRSKR